MYMFIYLYISIYLCVYTNNKYIIFYITTKSKGKISQRDTFLLYYYSGEM